MLPGKYLKVTDTLTFFVFSIMEAAIIKPSCAFVVPTNASVLELKLGYVWVSIIKVL